nr:hypothetical protein PanWU01x14_267450 [Ipomoea batatas]
MNIEVQHYLNCSSFLDKRRLHFVLQVINLLGEVELGCSWLNRKLLTERHPFPCKFSSFSQRLKCQHGSTIIRDIARDLFDRIIDSKNGQNSIGSDQRWFFQGIHRTDKEIHGSQPVGLALSFEPATYSTDEKSFLLGNEGSKKTWDLSFVHTKQRACQHDRSKPQRISTLDWICDSIVDEEGKDYEPHNDDSSVWPELGLWDWNHC